METLHSREARIHFFNAGWIWASRGMTGPDHGRFSAVEKKYSDLGRAAYALGLPHYGFINPLDDSAYNTPDDSATKEA